MAYRLLGSASEADDAVQEAWERVGRAGADGVEDLKAWLTTIVARVCLNLLRSRTARRERPIPDPIVSPEAGPDPEAEAVLADSVGFALQIVIGTLAPAERLAFVLHDIFDLALRRDRGDSWPHATGNQTAGQQSPPPSEGG